ncbi:MAG TPA: ATP-binding protein [Acidimicrobiales bacterium]|jgi:anti-sigma regulatory factor (Ser/Thr protein kinase)|nr:ATP-binding protein [Acidimicrobiales bacterium]
MAESAFKNERCIRLSCHPTAPGAARTLARCLAPAGAEATTELVASELVTNAVLYAQSDVELTILNLGDRVRVEVSDGSSQLPEMLPVQPGSEWDQHGRGLHLVAALASTWGCVQRPGGKTVWCEISTVDADEELAAPSPRDKNPR